MFQYLYESVVDNLIRDKVDEPEPGCVVYCDLALGFIEHSGIYVGDNTIIHLTKEGIVERCTPKEFMQGTTARNIYVGCFNKWPAGSPEIARRAIDYADKVKWRDYGLVLNNCHIFSEYCVTGRENTTTFLTFLKDTCEREMAVNSWRVWDLDEYLKLRVRRSRERDEIETVLAKVETALKEYGWQIDECQRREDELVELIDLHFDLYPLIPDDIDQWSEWNERKSEWESQDNKMRSTLNEIRKMSGQIRDAENELLRQSIELTCALKRLS